MGTRAERRPAWVLVFLGVAGTIPVLRSLLVPDVNWCYPYMSSDSYDWINNALYWAGAPFAASLRPPGFALVIALLWKLGALRFLPIINFLFLGLSTAALYALLRERHDGWLSATACWFFFANGYVQDFSRYLLAETYATPFLVLATLAFVRAERAPRAWIVFGLCIGVGFLFSYVAVPAAIGLAAALLAVARGDLRRKELWYGVIAGAMVAGAWVSFRWLSYRAHPNGPRHGVEALLRPSLANVPFYVFAAAALVGVVPVALYLAGALRFARIGALPSRFRAAVLGPLFALALFWVFVYDWADKRFLLYVLPFLTCFLAEGLETLRAFARNGPFAAVAAAAFLALALFWNQIRYPSYGINYFALTPEHFLEARLTSTPAQKVELHLEGARIVRLHHHLLASVSRGLFDPRRVDVPCAVADPAISCLSALKIEADRVLQSGQPIGLLQPRGWPPDYWASRQRLANVLLRPVILPTDAELTFAGIEAAPAGADLSRTPFVAACGPYVLVRMR